MAARAIRRSPATRKPASLVGRPASVRNSYDAGAQGRRTARWHAPTTSANESLLNNLTALRDRSRAATRNDGYARSVINALVANIIGTGIQPISQARDPQLRRRIQELWLNWTDESDADGLLDFYGQQTQAVRTWLTGGEAFGRIRPRLASDGLSVPLQIQLLEPELCPHTHHAQAGTTRIRAGIEFNAIGRRVAYWVHPSRPEQDDYDRSQLRRLDATLVTHLYNPLRPGQLRGEPHLVATLIRLHEIGKYDDASLLRQELANMFVGFVKRSTPIEGSDAFNPLTGSSVETSTDGKPMVALEPGIFQELEPGEEVEFSEPPAPNGYADFMRAQLQGVAAATDVPYEVITGDLSKVNDRTVRVILNEFRRRIQAWQHQIVVFQFCRPIWRAWMDRVYLSGALPIPDAYLDDPTPWLKVRWQPQGWPYIHPVQDVQANSASVQNGFKSRRAVVAESGDDVEAVDDEQREDNDRADALGLRHTSDGRTVATATGTTDPAPDPDPEDPETKPEPEPAGAAA